MEYEVVRMSPQVHDAFSAHMLQKKILDLTMELMTLRDLVTKLDPAHMYVFSPEYQAFIKTPHPKEDV